MTSIKFTNNGYDIVIQCNKDDKMKDIINNYIRKADKDKNLLLFLYSGKAIDEELKLSEIISEEEKDKMQTIVVYSKDNIVNKSIIKSKYIICPICGENIRMKLNNYKIFLSECKNGHRKNNILLNEFEKTQYIDISKIICGNCKVKNKSNTYNNEFYKCITCGINICPLCKSSHDKSHAIINYDGKNFTCPKHDNNYAKYCDKCKMNICCICEKEHKNHSQINFGDMIPNVKQIKEYMNKLNESINVLKNNIEEVTNKLNKVLENVQIYYNINNELINNFKSNKINYEILFNMQEINNNNIIETINTINNDKDIKNKFNKIINLYDKMFNKDKSEITLIYDINNKKNKDLEEEEDDEDEDDTINIFGSEFVRNNKKCCTMIIDDKEYELTTKFNVKNYDNNKLEIKLKGIDNVTDMSYFFYNCSNLSSLHNVSKLNTNNVTKMSDMFYGCSKLKSLPDISKWNTSNVTYMREMFCGCSSLKSLPDISKWNTSNVINMSSMFYGCSSLKSLPDISKWDTSRVTHMREMFYDCSSLSSLPDISKWNNKNIDMNDIFKGCKKAKKK